MSSAANNWEQYYNYIKDPSWPAYMDMNEFNQLPEQTRREILSMHPCEFADVFPEIEFVDYVPLKPLKNNKLANYIPTLNLKFLAGDITVVYDTFLDGGGTSFGQNFSKVIKTRYPGRVFNRALEWCAGPGFIGFRLLSDKLCNSIWFSEIYKPAIYALNQTIATMPDKYRGQATALNIGDIKDMPNDLVFDLIVANPPMFSSQAFAMALNGGDCNGRIAHDPNWEIHENFFQHISKHLAKDGVIILVEHTMGSGPKDFEPMILANGLKIVKSYSIKNIVDYWYLEITHQ